MFYYHLVIFEFNKKYTAEEHIGEVQQVEMKNGNIKNEIKVAEVFAYTEDNDTLYLEARTPTQPYPNDLKKGNDELIGIYPTIDEMKRGVKNYYKRNAGRSKD